MKIAEFPYNNYRICSKYFHKGDGRFKIELVHLETNERYTLNFARYLMEVHLKRKLENYIDVHHINENKTDDRIENLEILTINKHSKLHAGNNFPDKRIYIGRNNVCRFCSKSYYLNRKALSTIERKKKIKPNGLFGEFCSRFCFAQYRAANAILQK